MLGNYTPRRCGIATFTEDLTEALQAQGSEVTVIAMDDRPESYSYPDVVGFRILQEEIEDYRKAALYISKLSADVLCVQHEFGIFGGSAGSHLLELLEQLDIPIVVTLHTILRDPDAHQMHVMKELDSLAAHFIVMSERGKDYLCDIYGIAGEKVDVIHHGIHPLPRQNPEATINGKRSILTFGLLGPDKGIENVISALPEVFRKHTDVEYVVVGATHPNLVAQHGESYRESLINLAREVGVLDRVRFVDKFVTKPELAEYMRSACVYVTPYNKLQQITSGTLAYAVGTGRAVVSTPYWYAEELLADGRGILVPPKSPAAIATALDTLLSDEAERANMAARALEFGEQMLWVNVAKAYGRVFASTEARRSPAKLPTHKALGTPRFNLGHLQTMTDDVGMLQHATYTIPNRSEGYCVDDNARALQFVTMAAAAGELDLVEARRLSHIYLGFVAHAFNQEAQAFRNFMSYERLWLEDRGSDDAQGRTMRALGITARSGCDANVRTVAMQLFDQALPQIRHITSPRAIAFAVLGLVARLECSSAPEPTAEILKELSSRLVQSLQDVGSNDWPWFEDSVTYNNAILPHAMLAAANHLEDARTQRRAIESMEWLATVQTDALGRFLPIGSNGFKMRGGGRALYDQQPVEAWASASAYAEAFRVTRDPIWLERTQGAFEWFLGENHIGMPLYDATTGGCRDGLHRDRLNQNQGAESTLAFLMSLCEWKQLTKKVVTQSPQIVHSM